jgi:hypothetical protein
MVRVDSKHHFVYVDGFVPTNYALVTFMVNDKPTGVVAMYELVTADGKGQALAKEVKDSINSVSPCDAIAAHVRNCLLPRFPRVGDTFKVSFIGKEFNSTDHKWREGVCQIRPTGRQDL